MKKHKVREQYYVKTVKSTDGTIRFKDLPSHIENEDIIEIVQGEYYGEGDFVSQGITELTVYRERKETDEECQKRIDKLKLEQELSRKRRYEQYLKLKEEFNNI